MADIARALPTELGAAVAKVISHSDDSDRRLYTVTLQNPKTVVRKNQSLASPYLQTTAIEANRRIAEEDVIRIRGGVKILYPDKRAGTTTTDNSQQ